MSLANDGWRQAYLESLDVALPESEALSRLLQNSIPVGKEFSLADSNVHVEHGMNIRATREDQGKQHDVF